jgi:hypothetical protein
VDAATAEEFATVDVVLDAAGDAAMVDFVVVDAAVNAATVKVSATVEVVVADDAALDDATRYWAAARRKWNAHELTSSQGNIISIVTEKDENTYCKFVYFGRPFIGLSKIARPLVSI